VRRLLPPIAVGFLTALVLVAAVFVYANRTLSDEYLYLPDPAQDAAPVVSVAQETADPGPDKPGILFVAVVRRKATLLETWFSGLRERGSQLVSEEVVLPNGQTPQQRAAEDAADMSQSQKVAAAVALRALGEDVVVDGDGARVAQVIPNTPASAAGILPGDVIVKANDTKIAGVDDLQKTLASVKPGDTVKLAVQHAGRPEGEAPDVREPKTIADPNDANRAVMGVRVEDDAEITLPRKVEFKTKDIGGPSAGLPFALEIYNSLSDRSLVGDHRIAATGEIHLDGTVGAIGGAEQKAIGAREAGADVFLVPADNLAAAQKYAPEGLKIIPVHTFDEALEAIRSLPPLSDSSKQAAE
jgi:PDZ domain-containing protein